MYSIENSPWFKSSFILWASVGFNFVFIAYHIWEWKDFWSCFIVKSNVSLRLISNNCIVNAKVATYLWPYDVLVADSKKVCEQSVLFDKIHRSLNHML